MADGARGGKVGRAERRALRHAAMHSDMDKASQTGDTGSMNGRPYLPSGMDDTPGAGLQSQWSASGDGTPQPVKGTDAASVDDTFVDGQEASMDEPDDGTGEWEPDEERELIKRAQERAATAEIGDDGNLARGAMTSTASHPTMTMPGPQDTGRPVSYDVLNLHPRPGAPDKSETLTQTVPCNQHGGTVTVESRNLRVPAAGTPSVLGFDHDPAVGPGQGAATHGGPSSNGLMPCKPTGPSTPAVGIKYTIPAPGEQR